MWRAAGWRKPASGSTVCLLCLECKTTFSLDLKQFNGVEFPVQYYAQCIHYLAVTGADRWYLAVLAYGRGFFTFTLERDQAEIDALMAAEADF